MKQLYPTVITFVLFFFTGCKERNEPVVSLPTLTTIPAKINAEGFLECGGIIEEPGSSAVTDRGVCWSTSPDPTVLNQKISLSTVSNNFIAFPKGLAPGITYYFRAYATNGHGTAYGNQTVYKGGIELLPVNVSYWGEQISTGGILQNIRVVISGLEIETVTSAGTCWSSEPNPTILDSTRMQTLIKTSFNTYTSVLKAKSKYYFRAFAKTKTDIIYSNELVIETPLKVGYLYGGGIIFSLNDSKTAGTIVSTAELELPAAWSPPDRTSTPTGATSQTDGASNTEKIIAAYGNTGIYAAKVCKDYRGGGFSDWYLPSKQELELLDNQLTFFRVSYKIFRYRPETSFWSSTESSGSSVLQHDFNVPQSTVPEQPKSTHYRIFPVRAFTE